MLLASVAAGQPFVLNGSATAAGGECYQLTPDSPGQAGSFFSQNTIDLTQPFSKQASLFFGCKDGNGADGIVFILGTSNTAVGGGGGRTRNGRGHHGGGGADGAGRRPPEGGDPALLCRDEGPGEGPA